MLIHSNQTRFTCADCGRKFRHPSHFKEHRRRHTGESPYECSDCMLRLVFFNAALQKMCGSETSSFTRFLFVSVTQLQNKHLYDIHMIVSNGFIHLFHWHVQNVTIPCHSQELLPFLSVIYFLPVTLLHQLFFYLFRTVPLNFRAVLLNLVVSKFIYDTVLGILFSYSLFTCPNEHNLFNITVCYSGFFNN